MTAIRIQEHSTPPGGVRGMPQAVTRSTVSWGARRLRDVVTGALPGVGLPHRQAGVSKEEMQ
jgi:hypothetical protein